MGLRLYSEYDSVLSDTGAVKKYRIEIHEEAYNDQPEEIKCRATGLRIKREAKGKDFPQFILPVNCEVNFLIDDAGQLSFFEDLGTASEAGLILKVIDRDTSANEFIGKIAPDLLQIADTCIEAGIPATIKALDGLAMLKDIPYIDSQAAEYFNQVNDHTLRAEISPDWTQTGSGSGTSDTLFNTEIEDPGDRYDPVTGEYLSGGVTGDWHISLIVHARPSADYEDVWARIIRIDTGAVEHEEAAAMISFETDGVTQRKTLNVKAEDIDLADGEKMIARIEWQDDWHFLTFEEGSSFYNYIKSSKYNLKNVYAPAIDHIKNLLQATGLHNEYGATDEFFRSITLWNEENQSDTISLLTYLNIPYNAFITDYKNYPVTTLSCYDCLAALCRGLGAFLTYEDGKYLFAQYDALINNNGVDNLYEPDFDLISTGTYSDTQTEPDRLIGGNFTFLPSIRELSTSFPRWNSPNFLQGAVGVVPDNTFTNEYTKSGETVKFVAKIRFNNNPLPFVGFTGRVTHAFEMTFKIGSYWMSFDQLTFYVSSGFVYYPGTTFVPTTWENTLQVNTLLFPLIWYWQTAPIEVEVIGELNGQGDIFDPPPESGSLEFSIDYDTTYHNDVSGNPTDTVLALNYEFLDFQFLNTDEADNIITETVTNKYINGHSTAAKDIPIIFSDRTTLDQDPGRIQIDDGGLVDAGNFEDGTTSLPFQQFLTHFYSSITSNRIKQYNGALILDNPILLTLVDTLRYFSIKSEYNTVYNEQRGNYSELNQWTVNGDFIETIGNPETGNVVTSTLPGTTTGNSDPTSGNSVSIIHGSDTLNNATQLTPHNYNVKGLEDLSDDEINQIFHLYLAGELLVYPTHYSLTFAELNGYITFPRPIQDFELITWKVYIL